MADADLLKRDIPHVNGRHDISNWKPPGYKNKVYNNILYTIGNTPLVRLNRIPKDHNLECEIYAKCEFFNPGGSIKDRIAYTMMLDAENRGVAKPGSHFVEPTSGNTGIGLSLATAIHGYKCTILTPDKNSDEKVNTMHLLGATIIQAPSELPHSHPESYLGITKQILSDDPQAICLNQYSNSVNPATHYEFTAEEIVSALGQVDMVVAGTGTGGTFTGIAHRMKELNPECLVVAVDPDGSIIFDETNMHQFLVEGIGGDFVPDVLDRKADRVERPNDSESFNMAREIIRKEGILCGGSSGAAMFAAVRAAQEMKLGAGKRVVVIFADSIRNYMNKFVSDQWMEANLFKEPPIHDQIKWWTHNVSQLKIITWTPTIEEWQPCSEALQRMGLDHRIAIITDDNGNYVGAISKDSLRKAATNPKNDRNINLDDSVKNHKIKYVYKLVENKGNPTVGLLSRMLDITPFVVIVEKNNYEIVESYKPKGIVTPEIVMEYIMKHCD